MKIIRKANLQKWRKHGDTKIIIAECGIKIEVQQFVNPSTARQESFPVSMKNADCPVLDFSIFKKNEGITICPLTKKGRLVLIRQYKQGVDDFVIEFPAGNIDGEDKAEAARRELLEETGYCAEKIILLGKSHLMPRKSPSAEYAAVALGCRLIAPQRPDESEGEIEVLEVTKKEFASLVRKGLITSAPTKLAAFMATVNNYI